MRNAAICPIKSFTNWSCLAFSSASLDAVEFTALCVASVVTVLLSTFPSSLSLLYLSQRPKAALSAAMSDRRTVWITGCQLAAGSNECHPKNILATAIGAALDKNGPPVLVADEVAMVTTLESS